MRRIAILVLTTALAATSASAARIVIRNNDSAGQGFNETTPAQPVGGNPGTTLGQQRLNAFQRAADIWGGLLQSNVEIIINATFSPINSASTPCDDSGGILGSAGPTRMLANFEKAPVQNVAYPIALANSLAGKDLAPEQSDISARFNSLVDNATCLGTRSWYYGLDGNHGSDIDLVVVLLHELAHGLGVSGNVNLDTGALFNGVPSPYEVHSLDATSGLRWIQMTDSQRLASMTNTTNLVWDGASTTAAAAKLLRPTTTLTVTAPAAIARNFELGFADFGARADSTSLSGRLAGAVDAANDESTSTDGCTAYTNANDIAGKIAFVDRGACTFVVKARNAQTAGAKALVIADNRADTCIPPGMTGVDAGDITIPVMSLRLADGIALRAQLGAGIDAALRIDPTEIAGANKQGQVRLYAPCTLEAGSSVHHFDVTATPNLLMEPSINSDLLHNVDITLNQLIDIGWVPTPRTGRRILVRGK